LNERIFGSLSALNQWFSGKSEGICVVICSRHDTAVSEAAYALVLRLLCRNGGTDPPWVGARRGDSLERVAWFQARLDFELLEDES